MACYKKQNFYKLFKDNMNEMGMPAPATIYGSAATAIGTAKTLLGAVNKVGVGATVGEIAVTGGSSLATVTEIVWSSGGVLAAGYAGAVVGSIVMASGTYLGCGETLGSSIFQLLSEARKLNLHEQWLGDVYWNYPEIILKDRGGRRNIVNRLQVA